MKIDILTLFPSMFDGFINESIIKRAIEKNLVEINIYNIRDYSTFKNNGICHFDIEYLNPFTAIKAIKDAGGYAVLAHSGQQQNFELIPELVKAGLDGLELNHHANADKDKVIIREYADKYHLFLTGGSDCHGRYEPNSPEVGDYLAEQSGAEILF